VVFVGGLRGITKPLFASGQTTIPKERYDAVIEIYDFVETFLTGHDYIAGNQLTIADFSLITSITALAVFVDIDPVKYSKITAWIKKLEELPYFEEANGKGARELVALLKKFNVTIAS